MVFCFPLELQACLINAWWFRLAQVPVGTLLSRMDPSPPSLHGWGPPIPPCSWVVCRQECSAWMGNLLKTMPRCENQQIENIWPPLEDEFWGNECGCWTRVGFYLFRSGSYYNVWETWVFLPLWDSKQTPVSFHCWLLGCCSRSLLNEFYRNSHPCSRLLIMGSPVFSRLLQPCSEQARLFAAACCLYFFLKKKKKALLFPVRHCATNAKPVSLS